MSKLRRRWETERFFRRIFERSKRFLSWNFWLLGYLEEKDENRQLRVIFKVRNYGVGSSDF